MSLLSLEDNNMADALRAMSNGSFEPPADEADLPKTAHQSIFSAGAQNGHSPVAPPPPIPADGKPVAYSTDLPWDVRDDDVLGLTTKAPRPSDSKIKAFFGTDAPQHYLETINADAKPWYLRPNYDSAEILLDPDGTVRGGTVPALVERLTAHEYADPKFIKAFLMTYKSFTNLDTLFTLLVERFWIQPPENLNAAQLGEWRKFKQYIIRTRVMNTVKSMVQDTDVLEKEDMYILDRMQDFVSRDEVISLPAAKSILDAIKRAQRGKKMTIKTSHQQPPPPPIVPKRIDLLDIDALELARQLTITESQLYLKIRPIECLHRSKQQKTDYNDNIAIFIRRSNRIANWVAYAVLCKEDSRRRASVMKHFINIADRCRSLQNFSTMLAIVSGLNSSPIRRLKRSWEQVSAKLMSQLETCETTINSYKNFNIYRSALAKVSPPCVPFIGVFLTALTHIQDGSKDSLPGHLVNFRKRQKASEVIQDLQQWQAQPHNFRGLPSVLAYIEDSLNQFGDKDVGDDFWELSLAREPREKEEEKLARPF
ncbi:hypothetical protein SERLADRAFT_469896 [Serpula lacrymans var. lacrymans S7.9]|uniref:Ras GEF n=1 Tax=Serpula lacrymans var. lacrymans (strain S7.9) TaxID=578457 RepID=F8NYM1_SERL9|nr:uncharacterized protein SERLADRAFT_469896 [Serpula lacrymans var. lacrymans S7.9]EGO23692.1 hypothetical protein SERLADRAFT_469896 [Serpula lacrymans var. lacrymans S7.9]